MDVPIVDLSAQRAEGADEISVWPRQYESASEVGVSEVAAFEAEFADYIGVGHCVAVGNGTGPIEVALRAAGIGAGDEVILPANASIATAEAISGVGATPVLADVDDTYLLINPAAVATEITRRTRAIMAVDMFGQTAPIEALKTIVRKRNVMIIEDASQSLGASSSHGRAGAFGRIAVTSFCPGGNLTIAGGCGAVLTDDTELAEYARSLSSDSTSTGHVHDQVVADARIDAVQAAALRAELRRLHASSDARRAAAKLYNDFLGQVPGVRVPAIRPGNEDVWSHYVIRVQERDRVLSELNAAGIRATVQAPTPIHLNADYADLGHRAGCFPVAEAAAETILSLPVFPQGEQVEVVFAVLCAISRAA